jgi:hypothetical protein
MLPRCSSRCQNLLASNLFEQSVRAICQSHLLEQRKVAQELNLPADTWTNGQPGGGKGLPLLRRLARVATSRKSKLAISKRLHASLWLTVSRGVCDVT